MVIKKTSLRSLQIELYSGFLSVPMKQLQEKEKEKEKKNKIMICYVNFVS